MRGVHKGILVGTLGNDSETKIFPNDIFLINF
jgi:single-stranded DNA-binding protein